MIETLLKALEQATAGDVLAYAGVYIAAPLGTLWLVNEVKRTRKHLGRKLSVWQLRSMAALVSGVSSLFFGNRMAGWPIDQALNHAIVVMFLFPLIATVLIERVKAVAPGVADDLGDLPTELRAADTSEFCADSTKRPRNPSVPS